MRRAALSLLPRSLGRIRFLSGGVVHDMALRAALDAMSQGPSATSSPRGAPLLPDVEVDAQTWKSLVVR